MAAESLQAILACLKRHEVPLVVIGGIAVNAAGYLRATEDLDIVFIKNDASIPRLAAAFKELEAVQILDEKDPATGREREIPAGESLARIGGLMMVYTKYGPLDIFDFVPGCDELSPRKVYEEASETDGVRYASRRHLTQMKLAAARTKDLKDLQEIGEFSGPAEMLAALLMDGGEDALEKAFALLSADATPEKLLEKAVETASPRRKTMAELLAKELSERLHRTRRRPLG